MKKRINHREYLVALRNMSPEQRLLKALELSIFAKKLFLHGLRKRFPELTNEEFQQLVLERLEKCHNRIC